MLVSKTIINVSSAHNFSASLQFNIMICACNFTSVIDKKKLSNVPTRMPGERPRVRDVSEVGRFPRTAPPTRVELAIHKEGEKKAEEEGGCLRWLRKACPCCCKRQNSTSYDLTNKVDLVKPPAPAPVTDPEPAKPKPGYGEAMDMEGKGCLGRIFV